MGEPLRVDSASVAPAVWTHARRVLLLCAEADRSIVELTRPELELQRFRVDVVTHAFDAYSVQSAIGADPCPTVVAVVVSRARVRATARPLIDAFSEVAGPLHRLFILDLRRRPGMPQQIRDILEAARGLELTMEVGRTTLGALTASATRKPQTLGEVKLSPSNVGTRRLQVVHPPVLLGPQFRETAQTIPPRTRFRVSDTGQNRHAFATRPDLPQID